jgi:dihydrofolate reductase
MRKVTFGCATSLDNYIARSDHSVDWLLWAKEVADISGKLWKTIDTVVMGRKTYEVALRSGITAYPEVKNYVFSRTMTTSPDERVTVVSEDAASFVRKLKRRRGKGICVMGGGEIGTALLAANLIDEIGSNIHPVLLGSGIPLFHPMKAQINLQLLECKPLKNGCVYVLYRVKR